mmetsp:Transcript_77124/g.193975  ORF Transcript_77124/g.193975 Transcript_77124/m.193975 type:complete len:265 (-) Transcript_77124:181-975(-)
MAALSRSDHLLRPEARGVLPDVELHRRARRELLAALDVVLADEEPALVLGCLLVLDLLSWLDPTVFPLPVRDCPCKLLGGDPVPWQKVSLSPVRIELALALAFAKLATIALAASELAAVHHRLHHGRRPSAPAFAAAHRAPGVLAPSALRRALSEVLALRHAAALRRDGPLAACLDALAGGGGRPRRHVADLNDLLGTESGGVLADVELDCRPDLEVSPAYEVIHAAKEAAVMQLCLFMCDLLIWLDPPVLALPRGHLPCELLC